ncbi:CDP-diacylglycerol--serine O-phosphatidyltransferase [Pedobacter namyangjuensis]|uniref:CDP-diacylglycerol--serine O-phosphatidyltransferase n=1 Tax=Pedobacter namyangjuensis TaxID=600626 RepID=UPI000DE51065|nr:CDP-diacylglycerol--serine O-phosphatidyltransferase [Pedobacter namyangjuensis]
MKKHIPNAITCANLFSGCIGIVFAFNQNLKIAALCIFISLLFDFFDGFVARLLKVSGDMGKELDSLADVVSFGVLPSIILFQIAPKAFFWFDNNAILPYFAFFIAVFSAYRLAKFNLDTRQTDQFIGLPTPANAILIASIPLIYDLNIFTFETSTLSTTLFLSFIALMCFLLVCELPLIALKFKTFGFKENMARYLLIISSVILVIVLKYLAIPAILLTYILLSIVFFKRKSV